MEIDCQRAAVDGDKRGALHALGGPHSSDLHCVGGSELGLLRWRAVPTYTREGLCTPPTQPPMRQGAEEVGRQQEKIW
jgi:hypothetical protein